MHGLLRPLLFGASVLLLTACSGREEPIPNPPPPASANAAVFNPGAKDIPLPNILLTATAANPLADRAAGAPMNPLEALAYINTYEVGSTHAVAGVNAPIYFRFEYPVQAATVNAGTIKVFQLTADEAGTENAPLGFQDVTGMFTFKYVPGGTDVWLFPAFPLAPGTRYAYVVTNRVMDEGTGAPVIPSFYFNYLKSTTALTGAAAPLEDIRANKVNGTAVLLSGYAKVMDDLIAASAKTTLTSRNDIVLLGRFITTGAGFIVPDPASPATRIPVETALRAFAAGAGLPNGLQGKTWSNTITVKATFTQGDANPLLDVGAYWQGVTGYPAATVPASLGTVVQGTFSSAFLGMDPVVTRANPASMDLSAQAATAFNPASGVLQPYRDGQGHLLGYYHVPATIPFVYLAPASAAPTGGYPLVLFQHGITKEKETAVALAKALTGAGFAILAIDLPLHGELAVPAQQFQAGDDAATKALKESAWGKTFMAVGAPLASRSNFQQAAFNLHRLELTVATGGFTGLGAKAPSVTRIQFAGMSLGAMVGAYYLAGNTALPYGQASLDQAMKGFLSVPGGRLAYLIQQSPTFGQVVDDGLATAGYAKGSPGYHGFFQLTQSVVDPVDPATLTTPLAPGLPSRFSGRLLIQEATSATYDASGSPLDGDLVITNPFTRYFGNALGGRAVLGTSAAAAVAPGFFQLGYGAANRIPAPFLYTLNGATPAPKTQSAALSPLATTPREGYFQFDQSGVGHGGLLDPAHPTQAGLMQTQLVYFLGASGTSIALDPTALAQ